MNQKDYLKVLIPMIRKVAPSLMAQEICGVQPMSTPMGFLYPTEIGEEFVDGTLLYHKWYWVKPAYMMFSSGFDSELYDWCVETFGDPLAGRRWYLDKEGGFRYMFKRERDRTVVLMKLGK